MKLGHWNLLYWATAETAPGKPHTGGTGAKTRLRRRVDRGESYVGGLRWNEISTST